MTHDTRIALFLMGELVAALRANDSDLFKRWLYGSIEDLGKPAVTEFLLNLLDPFLTVEEQVRLLGWHLAVNLKPSGRVDVISLGTAANENPNKFSGHASLAMQ